MQCFNLKLYGFVPKIKTILRCLTVLQSFDYYRLITIGWPRDSVVDHGARYCRTQHPHFCVH